MEKYDFKEVIDLIGNQFGFDDAIMGIERLKNVVKEENILAYYPKNIYNDNQFEYLVVTNDYIVNLVTNDEESVIINSFPISKVTKCEMNVNNSNVNLKICFSNDINILLDAREDSNMYHRYKYVQLIEKFYKSLISK